MLCEASKTSRPEVQKTSFFLKDTSWLFLCVWLSGIKVGGSHAHRMNVTIAIAIVETRIVSEAEKGYYRIELTPTDEPFW